MKQYRITRYYPDGVVWGSVHAYLGLEHALNEQATLGFRLHSMVRESPESQAMLIIFERDE